MKITDNKKRDREVVRASPTGLVGSVPLPGKKRLTTTYLETDLDSMETRDLAHCGHVRNSCPSEGGDDAPLYENLETSNNTLPNNNTDPNN